MGDINLHDLISSLVNIQDWGKKQGVEVYFEDGYRIDENELWGLRNQLEKHEFHRLKPHFKNMSLGIDEESWVLEGSISGKKRTFSIVITYRFYKDEYRMEEVTYKIKEREKCGNCIHYHETDYKQKPVNKFLGHMDKDYDIEKQGGMGFWEDVIDPETRDRATGTKKQSWGGTKRFYLYRKVPITPAETEAILGCKHGLDKDLEYILTAKFPFGGFLNGAHLNKDRSYGVSLVTFKRTKRCGFRISSHCPRYEVKEFEVKEE